MPQQLAADFDVEEVLGKLNMAAKIKLMSGKGWWHTESIPDIGIPSMRLSDGDLVFYPTEVFLTPVYALQDLTVYEAPDVCSWSMLNRTCNSFALSLQRCPFELLPIIHWTRLQL